MTSTSTETFSLAISTIETLSDGICWVRADGGLVYSNDACLNLLGYPNNASFTDLTVFEIISYYEPATWRNHLEALRLKKSIKFGTYLRVYQKTELPVEITARNTIQSGIEYICLVIVDKSEEAKAVRREKCKNIILEMITQRISLPEILFSISKFVEEDDKTCICSIQLLDRATNQLTDNISASLPIEYSKATDKVVIGPNIGSCGTAAYSKKRVIVSDIRTNPLWTPFRELALRFDLKACWSEPIIDNDRVIGVFAIYHQQPQEPSDSDIELLETYAKLAGIAIRRNESDENLRLSNLVFENSNQGMIVCNANDEILLVNPAFTEITGYTLAEVYGTHPKNLTSNRHPPELHLDISESLRFTGKWEGDVWDIKKSGEEFLKHVSINSIYDANGVLLRRVGLFSDVTRDKVNEERIWQEAHFDSLTSLPNRKLFKERLSQEISNAQRSNRKIALIYLDLDRFKEVNDAAGHLVGDKVLVEATRRLREIVESLDTIARIGGDEFMIIFTNAESNQTISKIASQLLKILEIPFELDNQVFNLSASIGITLYPQDATSIDGLISNADQAMYAAKKFGRNNFCFFTEDMQRATHVRRERIRDLRKSLKTDELLVYYQPIINLDTNLVVKAEALIRWPHPLHGMISPAEFIPLAEETGLIHDIGDIVLKAAISQLKIWQRVSQDFQISINLSPVQFKRLDILEGWLKYIKNSSIPPQSICFEITEGALLEHTEDSAKILEEFRLAGVQLAIDDFGTGYSSLAYINQLNVDFLKIDRTFVKNLAAKENEYVLVEAIIAMAHKLGIKVVAEGVETEDQKSLLVKADCDYAQGFLYSKPVPKEEFRL